MTYIDLINEFWTLNVREPFSAAEMQLYLFLLQECNLTRWADRFAVRTALIEHALRLSRTQITNARESLARRGLISYTQGSARQTPTYSITGLHRHASYGSSRNERGGYLERNPSAHTRHGHRDAEAQEPQRETQPSVEGAKGRSGKVVCTQSGQEATNPREAQSPRGVRAPQPGSDRAEARRQARLQASKPTPEEIDRLVEHARSSAKTDGYRAYLDWTERATPYVSTNLPPLTEQQFHLLIRKFGIETMQQCQVSLENRPDLCRRYGSLYITLNNWCQRVGGKQTA